MTKKRKTTTDAIEILQKEFIKGNAKRLQRLEKIQEDLSVAEQIYKLRTQASLSQKELASLIGTSQSDISRLENADYEGYSVKMLQRISTALHCRLEVRIVPENGRYAYSV
jgi:ribosome-binding protein aMBF1 (putative translation factor)